MFQRAIRQSTTEPFSVDILPNAVHCFLIGGFTCFKR